jgi:hypothetical protein
VIDNNSQEENLTAQRGHEEANPTFYAKSLLEKPPQNSKFYIGCPQKTIFLSKTFHKMIPHKKT